jgi:PPOX class probable F420-dependent enzyme
MTTVSPSGTPVPRPVWFVWEEDSVLMYSEPKQRIRNIETNPRVTLNFDGDGGGGDIVVLTGEAFSRSYSVPIRIAITRVDGH